MEYMGVIKGQVKVFGEENEKKNRVKVIIDEGIMKYEIINGNKMKNEEKK